MQRWLEMDDIGIYNAIKRVKKGGSVCQACNPYDRNVKGEAQRTVMCDQPMDLFCMPEVRIGKDVLDCVFLCVDRHSSYNVAVPVRKKGVASHAGCR